MKTIYPPGPSDVPAGLTRPTASYRRNAWLAVAGLLLFILLYFALTAWFAFAGLTGALRLAVDGGSASLPEWLACGGSLFLAVFLAKALFFIRKGEYADGLEVTRTDQPRLFAFLDQIADEAGAPRPNKVFVSARVNAAVFYDLSLVNVIRPSHKNLEIGLGLVNMLNLSEFKAVCAHEFGHFAQRSMAVGRWVYTTQQIAAHIVAKRDLLDRFLRRLSNLDVRISWIGWLLSLVVWALRAIVDTAFRLVILAQRALSREMEMQADLVAVSLTGSDALVHALHRLQIADDAWDRTLGFVRSEVGNQRPPRDVFTVHQAVADRLNRIYDDPAYGQRPRVPADGAAAFRVFNRELAQPPRMWATHPQNHEREENAKRVYLVAPVDERSAWALFDNAQELRERMTAKLTGDTEHAAVEPDVSLRQLDEQFTQEHLKPQYRGIYMGFSAVRHAPSADTLTEAVTLTGPLRLDTLYPATISQDLERLRALEREHALLCSLRDGRYDAPDGVIRHRDRVLRRAELPAAIAAVDAERAAVRTALQTVLKTVRSAHLAAADTLSPQWSAYLKGLLRVLHYADHAEANVRDAHAYLSLWRQRAAAGGSISEKGVGHILRAAEQLQRALIQVFRVAADVHPGASILAALGIESWSDALGSYGLNDPVRGNINDWLRMIDSWVHHAAGNLSALRRATLDELLRSEATVAAAHAAPGTPAPDAPQSIPSVPATFDTLVVGTERVLRVGKLTFSERFRTANGLLPGLARAAVALGIVGSVVVFGWTQGRVTISVYNGLARSVAATVDGQRVELQPGASTHLSVQGGRDVHIVTTAMDGQPIESFDAPVGRLHKQFVYTVAGAAPLRQWTATYGKVSAAPPRWLVPQRWQPAAADLIFTAPPERIQTKGNGGTRTVLDAGNATAPEDLIGQIADKRAAAAMLLSHVRYDAPDSPYLIDWLRLAEATPGFDQTLAARLAHFPADVIAMRIEQDMAKGSAHDAVCKRQRALAAASPDQPDLAYLATRCMPPGPEQDAAFAAGRARWPDSAWYALATAWHASLQAHYAEALADYQLAMSKNPALRQVLAVEAVRLMRVLDPAAAKANARELARHSPELRDLLLLEPDAPTPEGPYRAIVLLGQGRLDEAVAAAAGSPLYPHVLRMAAASTGASPALRAQAAALPPGEGIDQFTVWLTPAGGGNTADDRVAAVLNALERAYDSPGAAAKVQRFLALVRAGNIADADGALQGVPVRMRAEALAAGSVLLGDRAPSAWRTFARRALFSAERPYLGED